MKQVDMLRASVRDRRKGGGEISDELDKLYALKGVIARVEVISEAMKEVEGSYLCIREEEFPTKGTDILKWYSIGAEREESYSAAGGRQRKQEHVRDAYDEVFPQGHGGLSWKEVASKVRENSNSDFHVDTLKRALGLKAG